MPSPTDQIRAEMLLLYSWPKGIENEQQATAYLNTVCASLDRMKPNGIEAEHIWEAFKREWRFMTWPTPFELCSRLTKFRQAAASEMKAAGLDGARLLEAKKLDEQPYHHGEFMAALANARRNVAENRPGWVGFDRAILRMGEALYRNRDDQDRPRYPEAAE